MALALRITLYTLLPALCIIIAVPFGPPLDIADGQVMGISSLDAGDIDGDNRADVVILEGGKHADGRKVFAWYRAPSKADDAWAPHPINPNIPLRSFFGAARLADMDNDGDLDLVVASDNHSGDVMAAELYVFENPRPSAAPSTDWPARRIHPTVLPLHHINDMEIADLDGDGKRDIIVRSLEPNQIHLFFQDDGPIYQQKTIDTGIEASEGLAVGFIDGDSLPDLSFTGYWLKAPDAPRLQSYVRYEIDATYQDNNQNTKEAIGDIDGDGWMDVVIGPAESYRDGGPADLAWYKNPGGGYEAPWEKHVIQPGINDHHTVKLGDVDGNGSLDVVTGVPWNARRVQVYLNQGNGTFTLQTVYEGKGLYSGALADVDGDGDLDLIGQDTYARDSRPWLYENLLITK